MKTRRPSCWLLQWDKSRVDTNGRFTYLADLPDFVGTLPSAMSKNLVGSILSPLLMAYAPQSVLFKVDLARPGRRRIPLSDGSTISGARPKVDLSQDRPHDVRCTLGRMCLVARLVKDLVVVDNGNGTETMSWTEMRRFYYRTNPQTGESFEDEILPERRWEKTFPIVSHPFL
jgi:hypothetical protein